MNTPKDSTEGCCPSTPCSAWLPIITAPNSLNVILVTDGEDAWTDQKLGGYSGEVPGDYYFNGHKNWEEVKGVIDQMFKDIKDYQDEKP